MGFAMLNRHRGPEVPPAPKPPTREELEARIAELEALLRERDAELAALKSADVVINNPVLAAEVAEDAKVEAPRRGRGSK